MRLLLLISVLCSCISVQATTYYFSSTTGDDSYSVAEAQNAATPWRTLQKLNAIFSSLQPGDSILLKSGDVFSGSLIVSNSGSSAQPIVISSYGGTAKPVLSGLTAINSWTLKGTNLWENNHRLKVNRISSLFINGTAKAIGRYPNQDAPSKGYLYIDNAIGNVQITDLDLPSFPNWTGGEIVIRKNRWITDRNVITNHSGNNIFYQSESGYPAYNKYGYFIQNHPGTLDRFGEWYSKEDASTVGVLWPENPASALVEISTIETLVTCVGQSNIIFDGLTLKGANSHAFNLSNTRQFEIKNCEIMYSGVNGINAFGCNNVTVENCIINYSSNNGISGQGCSNFVIRKNKINNTGMVAGAGKGGDGNYEAIVIDGDGELIELNTIDSTGYIPITFRGNENIVKNNFINNFTLVKDDGGGIYTWNNIPGITNHGNKIIGNIVLNGKGAGEGTEHPDYLAANGIYMDDGTANAEIIGNTVAYCALQSLYIHNAHEVKIHNNTFFDSRKQVSIITDNFAPQSPVRNLDFKNNILFSKESHQLVAEFWTDFNDITEFGDFDNNYYVRPVDDNAIITTNHKLNGGNVSKHLTLDEWKNAFQKDKNSKKSPIKVPSSDFIRFEFNGSTTSKTIALDAAYIDVSNKPYKDALTLDPFSSVVLIQTSGLGDTSVPESNCAGLGSISREQWDNVSGNTIKEIPLHKTADSKSILGLFEGPTNIAENYGSRIRGYICPPKTGKYFFLLSGDDNSELWLSTDDRPENKVKIAHIDSWTNPREWNKYASQQSAKIELIEGKKYYIEALHKEGGGGDNLAVAWQLPNGVIEAPIPGKRLAPYGEVTVSKTTQTISFNGIQDKTLGDVPFEIYATASSGLSVNFRIVSGPATINGNMVRVTDIGTVQIEAMQEGNSHYYAAPAVTQSFVVKSVEIPSGCSGTGNISYQQWNNVGISNLGDLGFLQKQPDITNQLNLFEGPTDVADNYASRIRGYICPPVSGQYIFWISGDDDSELWLSTNDSRDSRVRIANISGWTSPREWNRYPTQKSALINLQAGQRYYIEALHVEGGGGDNLAVAWQLPNGAIEAPIPGKRLITFTSHENTKANQFITFYDISPKVLGSSPFPLNGSASSNLDVAFRVVSGPASLSGNLVTIKGVGTVTIEASQIGNDLFNAAQPVIKQFEVIEPISNSSCSGTGIIRSEIWEGVGGTRVSEIPFSKNPTRLIQLNNLESNTDIGDNYGTRIRGFICPPTTGEYTFMISGDDNCELWLSSDEHPEKKVLIAQVLEWTYPREWNKFVSQKSAIINLVTGNKYYIEVLHKEGGGGDNLSVAWQLPNGITEAPIPGRRLSPFESNIALRVEATSMVETIEPLAVPVVKSGHLKVYPNPVTAISTVMISAAETGIAAAEVLDIFGKRLQLLFTGNLEANQPKFLDLKASALAPGMYVVRLSTKAKVFTQKIVVVK